MEGVLQGTVFVKNSVVAASPWDPRGGGRYVEDVPRTAVRIARVTVMAIWDNSMPRGPTSPLRTRTNTRGEFRMIRVPAGFYKVMFLHDDFQDHSVQVDVGPNMTVRIDAGLDPKESGSDL